MHQIEDVECFANCTKLCKPHESNKMVWQIGESFSSADDAGKEKIKSDLLSASEEVKQKLDHSEFI